MDTNSDLAAVGDKIGGSGSLGLIRQIGRLKNSSAADAADVVGFDYVVIRDGVCYEYYAANPPLIGLTQPTPVPYPLGLAVINSYKVTYQQAVDIFHKGNWGSRFTSMSLSQPLHPDVKDPSWYMISDMGVHIAINANTGEAKVQS